MSLVMRNAGERFMVRDFIARALRAVLDEYMLNIMYDLPSRDRSGTTFIIDADAVENGLRLDELPQQRVKESA